METAESSSGAFELHGGVLCLDFVNTLDDRPTGEPKELLRSYADVVRFALQTGVIDEQKADELIRQAAANTHAAGHALHAAHALREAIYGVYWAIAKKQPVPSDALAQLNRQLQNAAQHLQLVSKGRHLEWQFEDSSSLDSILWPFARSAGDLLASRQLQFVHACSSKTCQWLFLDTSKNHRRRWCSMQVCGNRIKVRRFYRKARKR